jgi:hypothetical protein
MIFTSELSTSIVPCDGRRHYDVVDAAHDPEVAVFIAARAPSPVKYIPEFRSVLILVPFRIAVVVRSIGGQGRLITKPSLICGDRIP